ncbi:MAG: flippase activity-associated protein Agl23 [Candidatus Saccharicenans sp.]
MKKKSFTYLFVLILAAGLCLRLYQLDLRPMHHDEANQAYKFGELLEKGEYRYDPADHHGPTLYYFSLPFAWLSGQKTYASLTENTLRRVTVFFGLLTVLFLLAAGKNLSNSEKLWASLFLALSPPLVYFNRFYIQESLLVAFGLLFVFCMWRFAQKPDYREATCLGISAGLLYATKETSVIIFAAAAVALLSVWMWSWVKDRSSRKSGSPKKKLDFSWVKKSLRPICLALIVFAGISFLFYSSFFKYPQGFPESFRAFSGYFKKAIQPSGHEHPFGYYFSLLLYKKGGANSPVFSEIPFLLLALYGLILSLLKMRRRFQENFRAYIALFSLLIALTFSAIRYKTPWNMLFSYAGFLILAAVGIVHLLGLIKIRQVKIILAGALLFWAGWQTYLVNFYFHSYPDNPYVYAQTSPDFMRLIARVEELSLVSEEGKNIFIRVIAPPEETWPLPWYLRKYTRVGYWTGNDKVEALEPAQIIIISAREAARRSEQELQSYLSQYYSLRPDALLVLLIRQDLWQEYQRQKLQEKNLPGVRK